MISKASILGYCIQTPARDLRPTQELLRKISLHSRELISIGLAYSYIIFESQAVGRMMPIFLLEDFMSETSRCVFFIMVRSLVPEEDGAQDKNDKSSALRDNEKSPSRSFRGTDLAHLG
jgi:hypothetical protein